MTVVVEVMLDRMSVATLLASKVLIVPNPSCAGDDDLHKGKMRRSSSKVPSIIINPGSSLVVKP